ncbi:hypothetical protein VMCG_07010 [Cytospora schulzeri]|uniref:Rhodopsin domain-containing protein n=1 Tax=Cytospora schulzeri TaxID=448051 RepID=A0A423W429_9PEZI|nr:hypothetical protein VMCG_07010 [Valsa malicola]
MLDSLMLQSGADELAKTVHSISASVTTVFLFTRIWARTTHYQGLWWDDYILIAAWACQMVANALYAACPSHFGFRVIDGTSHGWTAYYTAVSFIYIAMALSKTAFATTLIRLSVGRTRILLWSVICVVCVLNSASAIVAWVDICEAGVEMASLSSVCVHIGTVRWIHVASAICMIFADIVLAYLPWRITANIFLPSHEKLGVSISLSLVGLAVPVCLTKAVLGALAPDGSGENGMPDWTYGLIIITCLAQAEVAIYIIAQTLPLIRVILQGDSKKTRNLVSSELNTTANISASGKATKATVRIDPDAIEEVRPSIELVQLSSGRIVAADSEEGKALRASQTGMGITSTITSPEGGPTPSRSGQRTSGLLAQDEVHKLWSDMGLSRRAWSSSPERDLSGGQQHLR